MTIHRSHHPVAAPVRYRKPEPSPERLLSAAEEARADLENRCPICGRGRVSTDVMRQNGNGDGGERGRSWGVRCRR